LAQSSFCGYTSYMQDGHLKSFIEEIKGNLGSHAHITAHSEGTGMTRLTCNADRDANPEQLLALDKLTRLCAELKDKDKLFLVLRTMIVEDPDGESPALCTVRGYFLTTEAWGRLSSQMMRENYSVDAATRQPVEIDSNLVFV